MSHDIDSLYQKSNICQSEQKSTLRGNFRPALDLYSTSQTKEKKCVNDAPIVFVMNTEGIAQVKQSCCNSWNCPRCSEIRAKQEYARIVNGAQVLSQGGSDLFLLTLTCRGKELSLKSAEIGYYTWTNKLLTAIRTSAKRQGKSFDYVQVTERQKRGHPHSHILTNYCPSDAISVDTTDRTGKRVQLEWSWWFIARNISAGLGNQCQIQKARETIGIASYIAKYLFKDTIKETWPPKWKRVRYSQKWPKLPIEKPELSFPLFTHEDWQTMDKLGVQVYTDNSVFVMMAKARGVECLRLIARSEKE